MTIDDAFTINDRDVILSGLFADGSAFSFDLSSAVPSDFGFTFDDFFDPDSTLTVTLVSAVLLGDCNLDGEVNFLDISPLIALLTSSNFLEQADCNLDGAVDFLDIAPFIAILTGN